MKPAHIMVVRLGAALVGVGFSSLFLFLMKPKPPPEPRRIEVEKGVVCYVLPGRNGYQADQIACVREPPR